MAKSKAPTTVGKPNNTAANRERRLLKHLSNFPNDKVAELAMKNPCPIRKKPKSKVWSKQDIAAVKLYILAGKTGKDYLADKNKNRKAVNSVAAKKAEAQFNAK